MFIFVSGPYSAQGGQRGHPNQVEANIRLAEEAGIALTRKGHIPFIPHTMMRGWENEFDIPRELALAVCRGWVTRCDALLYLGSSPGADAELETARATGLMIFTSLEDIPAASDTASGSSGSRIGQSGMSLEALTGYLAEYHECMESYRHTYETIWQAGGVFAAISAGLVAFGDRGEGGALALGQVLAPLPVIFWYLGVFRPMNRYGEMRNDRLKDIEAILDVIPGLEMRQVRGYTQARKAQSRLGRMLRLRFRVSEIVTVFGLGVLVTQIILAWKYLLG